MRYFWLAGPLTLLLSSCTAPIRQADAPIRIRWAYDPGTLDPLALPNQNAIEAANLLHQGLLQTNFQTHKYAPALAGALPGIRLIGDSLTQLDYRLREAATWDNGQPVLATDVAFTLKLMYCPGLPNERARSQVGFIRWLLPDPTDPRHFTLVCRGQDPEYTWASGDFPILPEAVLDPKHSLRQVSLETLQDRLPTATPLPALEALARRYQQADFAHYPKRLPGCGPYRLVAWEASSFLTFERKSSWWADRLNPAPLVLQARPKFLQFVILPEATNATQALRQHKLDLYPQISASDFKRLQDSPDAQQDLAFYTGPSYDIVMAGFNTRLPMLHDKLTRQALSCLFDPIKLLVATQLGQGHRTVGLLHPTSPYYYDSLPLPSYAPTHAAELLRRAGWQQVGGTWQRPPAQQLALSVRYRAGEKPFEIVAHQFRDAAATLGIPVELRPTEGTALTIALHQGDFSMYVKVVKGSPTGFNFAPILHSRAVGEGNDTGFGSPATDYLLQAIVTAGTLERKRHLLQRFQVLLQDEAPLVPLFFVPYRLVASRHLHHVLPSSLKPCYAAAALTWDQSTTPPAH